MKGGPHTNLFAATMLCANLKCVQRGSRPDTKRSGRLQMPRVNKRSPSYERFQQEVLHPSSPQSSLLPVLSLKHFYCRSYTVMKCHRIQGLSVHADRVAYGIDDHSLKRRTARTEHGLQGISKLIRPLKQVVPS